MMVSTSVIPLLFCIPTWTTGHERHLQPTGATVYLNETNIVVQEGDDGSASSAQNIDICIVVANNIEGLQRDIVVDLTVVPGNADGKSTSY